MAPLNERDDPFASVRREQDAWAAQAAPLAALRSRLEASVQNAPRPRLRQRFGLRPLLAAAAALVVVCAGVLWLRATAPLSFTVGAAHDTGSSGVWLSAPAGDRLPLQFSDGSSVVLEPQCRARVAETHARGAQIVVESGRVQVEVVPRAENRWRLSLGPFSVQVVGTRFGVAFDPVTEELLLEVQAGKVLASGCHLGDGRPVHAGERMRASCKTRRLEIVGGDPERSRLEATARTEAMPETPPAELPAPAKPAAAGTAAPSSVDLAASAGVKWRGLIARGDYKGAFAAAKLAGFERECQSASSAELIALGDAARFSAQTAAAEHAYLTLRRRFPGDGRAALAAFSLARIAFDQRGAHTAAARWFETYLRESPGGPLAREALGRLMESLQRSGQTERARAVAEDYVGRHPRGPHAELARRLLGE